MGNYFAYQTPEQPDRPFRFSAVKEDEMIVHRLYFLKSVLIEQRNEYQEIEEKEIAITKSLKKSNVSQAKFHLQKVKISRMMKNRIQDRLFLITKQINNLEVLKEDINFGVVIEAGNKLLNKLNKEVDSKVLREAMEVMESSESEKMDELFLRFQTSNESELNHEFEKLDEARDLNDKNLSANKVVLTMEDLEKKEIMFA